LIDAGHSLLVIEHNLDVVRAADWIIDLGPEGGDAGGSIVCAGTPAEVMRIPESHTGRAWSKRRATHRSAVQSKIRKRIRTSCGPHSHRNSRGQGTQSQEHRHRPRPQSLHRHYRRIRSGKSSLAFDILFAEGQRRYLESLNAYARQFVQPASRPDVDAIFGIPPTVAIEAAHQPRRPQEHRRHPDRDLSLSAPDVREVGRAILPACDARSNRNRRTPLPRRVLKKTTAVKKSPSSRR